MYKISRLEDCCHLRLNHVDDATITCFIHAKYTKYTLLEEDRVLMKQAKTKITRSSIKCCSTQINLQQRATNITHYPLQSGLWILAKNHEEQ